MWQQMASRLDSTDRKKEYCLLVAWIWTFLKRVWISFLATVTKHGTRNNSRKKGQPIMVQKAGQQEYWAAGHIASHSGSREQRGSGDLPSPVKLLLLKLHNSLKWCTSQVQVFEHMSPWRHSPSNHNRLHCMGRGGSQTFRIHLW